MHVEALLYCKVLTCTVTFYLGLAQPLIEDCFAIAVLSTTRTVVTGIADVLSFTMSGKDVVPIIGGASQEGMQAVNEQRMFAAQLAASVASQTPVTLSVEDQREALLALSDKRKREADAEGRKIALAKNLLHSAVWQGMAESTRFRFVAMDEDYYATGKIPLWSFTTESESDILLPGEGRCATSVTRYKSAIAKMAHDVHVKAKEQGSRVLSFLPALGKNQEVPEGVKGLLT
jgi:hypothetical protein